MSALLVIGLVLGVLSGYATLGVLYARSQAERVYAERLAASRKSFSFEDTIRDWARRETRDQLVLTACFWPFMLVGRAVVLVVRVVVGARSGNLLMGPLDERQAKAKQLRTDADVWAQQARTERDPDKRLMAEELARMLREQAQEVDL